MHVVPHDCDRQKFPASVGRCFLKLSQQDFGLFHRQQNRITEHLFANVTLETWKIFIVWRPGDIVFMAHLGRRILGPSITHTAEKTARIARQPVAVESRGQQPVTHDNTFWRARLRKRREWSSPGADATGLASQSLIRDRTDTGQAQAQVVEPGGRRIAIAMSRPAVAGVGAPAAAARHPDQVRLFRVDRKQVIAPLADVAVNVVEPERIGLVGTNPDGRFNPLPKFAWSGNRSLNGLSK